MSIVIVGLGNPGEEYEKTRHNAGRIAVTQFAKKMGFDEFEVDKKAKALVAAGKIEKEKITLVLPDTFMNQSGKAVAPFVKSKKAAEDLLVVQDDLDLPLGTLKLVFNRGSGGHKGVESIMRSIRTEAFARLRIGISGEGKHGMAKKPGTEEKILKHVIGAFSAKEEAEFKKMLRKVIPVIELFVTHGLPAAQQEANTKD